MVVSVTEAAAPHTFDAVCPHCRKRFKAELLAGSGARHRGFKCPHCRLFVPLDRAGDEAGRNGSG